MIPSKYDFCELVTKEKRVREEIASLDCKQHVCYLLYVCLCTPMCVLYLYVYTRVCVYVCVRACVHECVGVCMRVW